MARMDGNWSLTAIGVLFLALQPQACRDEATSHTLNDNTDVKPFLTDFATNIVSERLTLMVDQNAILVSALESASADTSNTDALLTAQQEWFNTMIQWQELEVMQVASLGSSLTTVGGEDVRDNIYSWPLNNPCRIDQVTATQDYTSTDFIDKALVSMRGLDAIEYLLFASLETECPSQVPPLSDGTWQALSDSDIQGRRLEYALVLAQAIQVDLVEEQALWAQEFPLDLYESDVKALNAVFNGMLYAEEMIKERKLHHPLGLKDECSVDCHLEVEGLYASISTEFLVANLKGLAAVVEGTDSGGFRQVLIGVGEEGIADEFEQTIEVLITQLEEIDEPLVDLIGSNPEKLDDLQEDLSNLTSLLKWDIATVLEMEIPQTSAGDND